MPKVPEREPLISERIRALREERGLTQEQLAKEVGTTRLVVHRWEKGRGHRGGQDPSRRSAERLAAYFGMPLEVFFKPPEDTRVLARLERVEDRLGRLEDLLARIERKVRPPNESRGRRA